jgi:ribosomal protein L11 methyltransferase
VLRLDPGMAFGTGLHPTTQLCIGFIEQYVKLGMQVLDLGCGSGILAIAAARLGATVLALDTDSIAVTATRENVDRNDVAGQVSVAEGSLGSGAALDHWLYPTRNDEGKTMNSAEDQSHRSSFIVHHFNVIVANIIARVLSALAADMAGALTSDGTLIASGIIADREHEVVAAFAEAGLVPLERSQEGDWVALVYCKSA